ncbi:hypothetical protein [Magnetospirillum gryphiswaldense]|nr:hypothetical protein [Magnetospirillum gryphiswaldense]
MLFLLLAVVAVPLKSHHEIRQLIDSLGHGTVPVELSHLTGDEVGLPLSLRMAVGVVYLTVHEILRGVAALMMIAPEASVGYQGTPWGSKAYELAAFQDYYLPFVSVFVTQILLLTPIALIALTFARSFPARAALLLAMVSCFGGWPPELINLVFWLGGHLLDWPRAYYLFADRYLPSDVAGLAYQLLLMVWLIRARSIPLTVLPLVVALGQFTSEHLGFIAGVAMAAHALWSIPDRRAAIRLALVRLALAGLVSVAVLMLMLGVVLTREGYYQRWLDGQSVRHMVDEYLQYKWLHYGKYNELWWRVIVANFVSYLSPPMLIGGLVGLVRARWDRDTLELVTMRWRAAGAVVAPLFLIMVIGGLNSGYTSDLGRQALPLAVMLVPLSAALAQRLFMPIVYRS